jgi:flagellar FliJ protein
MSNLFSLEGLLRLRKVQKDRAAAEVSLARARAAEVAARQRSTRASLSELENTDDASRTLNWVSAARSSTASTLAELDALEAEWQLRMEDARQRYAEAKTKAASLEKLEDRHIALQAAEANRSEQIVLDEISARTWHVANGKAL